MYRLNDSFVQNENNVSIYPREKVRLIKATEPMRKVNIDVFLLAEPLYVNDNRRVLSFFFCLPQYDN